MSSATDLDSVEVRGAPDGPVTVVVRRRIRAGLAPNFEEWLRRAIAATASFEGHLGAEVLRPRDPVRQDYVLIFRFRTQPQLEAWESSPQRAALLAEVEPMTTSVTLEKATGMEYWFHLPSDGASNPPPRHKMMPVTVVAIYPLVLLLAPVLTDLLQPLPAPLITLVTSVVIVILMTYVMMPLSTRLFARWLFRDR